MDPSSLRTGVERRRTAGSLPLQLSPRSQLSTGRGGLQSAPFSGWSAEVSRSDHSEPTSCSRKGIPRQGDLSRPRCCHRALGPLAFRPGRGPAEPNALEASPGPMSQTTRTGPTASATSRPWFRAEPTLIGPTGTASSKSSGSDLRRSSGSRLAGLVSFGSSQRSELNSERMPIP